MNIQLKLLLVAMATAFVVPVADAQEQPEPVKVVHVIGISGVKNNTRGTVSIADGNLRFTSGKIASDIPVGSVVDIANGKGSRRAVGQTLGTMSMAAPYGSGRVISLFRTKIDTLTIKYRDSNGGLCGVIFTMRVGTAAEIKSELVAAGAHFINARAKDVVFPDSAPSSSNEGKKS